MASLALQLDAAVRAACPNIEGVYIGSESDRTTWGIVFSTTNSTEIAAGNAALASFEPE